MALVPNGLLYFILMTSWISRSLMSPVAKQHTAAFDEIARVNQNYAKYQEGSEWQVDMKLPRRNVGRKGVDGSAPIRDRSNLWPKGIIPYTIAYSIPGNSKIRQLLKDAMAEYEKLTCIKFVERENQVDYVEFYYGEGCNSDVGRIGGRQTTSLGRGCAHHGIVVHELGHLVGFWHEQNRPDRDNYIDIKEENIIPKFKYAFHKYSSRRIDSLGVEYDYKSVMHYGAKAFSKNGLPTIVARQRSIKTFGNTNLSILDIQQVNLLYRCPDYPKFPQDFVWSSNGQMRKNATYSIYARCIRITHHRSASWRDNYMCYRKDKKSLSLSFSTRGPVPGKKCLQIRTPTKSYYEIWDRSYLCWPHDGIYKFKWLTHAPTAEERANCLEWSEPRDPTWGRNRYFLCATKDRKPIDGNWTRWTPWTTCTRKCGGGVQSRLRSCTNPQPSSGGQYCVGKASDTRMCNTQECAEWPKFPEDFSFGRKPRAGPNETCVRIFERLDYFTFKDYLLCSAADKRQPEMRWSDQGEVNNRECTRILVPEDSQGTKRGRWDNNYLCISTDGGFPYRFVWSYSNRIAGLPCMRWYAKNGRDGWDKTYLCAEDRFKSPVTPVVIINGGWSSWTSWNTCSKSCGSGKQHRVRQCDNPKPSRNGRTCQGKALDERLCNEQKCPSACGHEFQAVSGRFNSPNYPKPYPGKMNCEWVIRVPDGQRIEFKFLFFNVYGSYPLCDDSVSVYDGQTVSSRRIGKFCGSKLPAVLRSSSNVMLVKFHSNVQRGYYGFNAKWEAKKVEVKETANECGRQLTESTGTLTSPGYPGSYPPNADCIWVITAPRGHYIELKFKIFDIHKVGRGCRYDYVEVRDGNSRNSPSLGRHCGQSVDEKFQTMSNHARIRLHSDGSRERKGFVLTWRSLRKPVVTLEPTTKPLCPRGWVSHLMNGTDMVYCYLVRHNTHTWYMARNDCIRSRSDLLSISNAKEQEFVTKHLLAESFMWIGYNDIQREGQWAWSDSLVADVMVFNSQFNMESFLSSIKSFLKLMPDNQPKELDQIIRPKYRVVHFPLMEPEIGTAEYKDAEDEELDQPVDSTVSRPLHVVWAHRWEHDKGPELFFCTLYQLAEQGLDFKVSVLGETFSEAPGIFEEACRRIHDHILHWGYQESRKVYISILKAADVAVSTAEHEFFGVSMLEAVQYGCYPLCPNKLVYPEIFPSEYLYSTPQQLSKKLRYFCRNPRHVRSHKVAVDCERFTWGKLKDSFCDLLSPVDQHVNEN